MVGSSEEPHAITGPEQPDREHQVQLCLEPPHMRELTTIVAKPFFPLWGGPARRAGDRHTVGVNVVAVVIVIVVTVLVVVSVLGLHVWGAIQDGREQRRREGRG